MTSRLEAETSWARAGFSWAEDAVRWMLVNDPRPTRTARDAAFHAYLKRVRSVMRTEPAQSEVTGTRELAAGPSPRIVEVELTGPRVDAGDVLLLNWRNRPAPAAGAGVRYWTTPLPHRPSRRATATPAQLSEGVREEGGGRITPRFYTTADAGQGRARLHVTRAAAWPERSAAFLHRAVPGTRVAGWVLPHPHRVNRADPGCAIVTGSGAAGVFAGLRHGAHGVRLIWGIGDKQLAPWVLDELAEHRRQGAIAELSIVRSPQRVTDVLAERLAAEASAVRAGEWLYVSGNEAMGQAVDAMFHGALGADLGRAHDDLRYIVST